MPLVVDASIAFKWFVPEADAESALALLDQDVELLTPDLIFAEIGNAMWARLRTIEAGAAAADAAQLALRRIFNRIFPASDLVRRATQLAFELRHPVYDCVYLALCEQENALLVTADERLRRNLENTSYAVLINQPL